MRGRGGTRRVQNRGNARAETFVFPEGSHVYIRVPPHHVLSGPLNHVPPNIENEQEFAYVLLDERDIYTAYLHPQNNNVNLYNDYNDVYHVLNVMWEKEPLPEFPCFITRPNMTGVQAIIQPFNHENRMYGISRVYFTGPNHSFRTMGAIHDAGAYHPSWAKE